MLFNEKYPQILFGQLYVTKITNCCSDLETGSWGAGQGCEC